MLDVIHMLDLGFCSTLKVEVTKWKGLARWTPTLGPIVPFWAQGSPILGSVDIKA